MGPLSILNLEKLFQHRPYLLPGRLFETRRLGEYGVFIGQSAPAPKVKQQQKIGTVLLGAQVHRIGQVVANIDRHPNVGLACVQSL